MSKQMKEGMSIQIIDLNGPDGNAFFLLAQAEKLSSEFGLDFNKIQKEMTSGDYENLVGVFEKYFGNHVTIIR